MTLLCFLLFVMFVLFVEIRMVDSSIAGGWADISADDKKLRDYAVFAAGSGNNIKTVLSGAKQVVLMEKGTYIFLISHI